MYSVTVRPIPCRILLVFVVTLEISSHTRASSPTNVRAVGQETEVDLYWDADNGIESPKWSYWGGNPTRGEDVKYHRLVARWP